MIVRATAIADFLRTRGARQVSQEAVVSLASSLEALAERFLGESLEVFHDHNAARIVQRLPPLSRLTADHVKRALEKSHANR